MAKRLLQPMTEYGGPDHLADDLALALKTLASSITVKVIKAESHSILHVDGFESPVVNKAIAAYLVGAIAQCIGADLQIRAALFDETTKIRDLSADVKSVIGNAIEGDEYKTKQRNPWLWEGISHLLMHLAQANSAWHPAGTILVKTLLKFDVHDHGLDLVAIYAGNAIGITAGECKAYLDDPGTAITDASNRLREIDTNLRDMELRATVNQLRPALHATHQKAIAGTFWKQERSYFPFICCNHVDGQDWIKKRVTLERLSLPIESKLLVPLSLKDAKKTFDDISTFMRIYASKKGIKNNV